jgi:uncharacterized protein Veg
MQPMAQAMGKSRNPKKAPEGRNRIQANAGRVLTLSQEVGRRTRRNFHIL